MAQLIICDVQSIGRTIQSKIICTQGSNLKRKLFNLAVIVSMLLCIETGVLWVRSYFHVDFHRSDFRPASSSTPWQITIVMAKGTLRVSYGRYGSWDQGKLILPPQTPPKYSYPSTGHIDIVEYSNVLKKPIFRVAGFDLTTYESIPSSTTRGFGPIYQIVIITPFWMLFLIFAILPVWWLVLKLRENKQIGHCQTCGYDLRATPERCPECGTVVSEIKPKEKLA